MAMGWPRLRMTWGREDPGRPVFPGMSSLPRPDPVFLGSGFPGNNGPTGKWLLGDAGHAVRGIRARDETAGACPLRYRGGPTLL
jgi:hypothetical protein